MIKDKDGKVNGIGTRSRGNVFQLNPNEMTCLDEKVDDSWLWHKIFYHIKFDSIVRTGKVFVVRDLPKL